MKILVTGCAGFIGFHITKKLLSMKYEVFGIDNLNNYYDIKLKQIRLKELNTLGKKFTFKKIDISKHEPLEKIFKKNKFSYVINLAAQAGVRTSIQDPRPYIESNVVGFFNLLELSRKFKIKHLLFASTSSVYGNNNTFPSKENFNTDEPLSFYAATKKSNEIMAFSYSHIYKLPCTALRFFTVYGPLGRPDMAIYKFTDNIANGRKIDLYNKGDHVRDFTFIDDVVMYVIKLLKKAPKKAIPYDVYNIGNSKPKKLIHFLNIIEKHLSLKANVNLKKMQLGDVHTTYSNNKKIIKKTNYLPKVTIDKGISKFVEWYRAFYK